MSRISLVSISLVAIAIVLSGGRPVLAGPIDVTIYRTVSDSPTGIPYGNFVGSFSVNEVRFASDTGYNWHPFGLATDFGGTLAGQLSVAAPGTYTFSLASDSGSRLFIDYDLAVDNGGDHGPLTAVGSRMLLAGTHPFAIQFRETGGGASGLDLHLPEGVRFLGASEALQAPEPAGRALFGIGMIGLLGCRLRRRAA